VWTLPGDSSVGGRRARRGGGKCGRLVRGAVSCQVTGAAVALAALAAREHVTAASAAAPSRFLDLHHTRQHALENNNRNKR